MLRDERAYLSDILEACEAIRAALRDLDFSAYQSTRLIRSAVEREFIIIGEAIAAIGRVAPASFAAISRARRIVDFRNQLTHAYTTVDDALVWAIIEADVPILQHECAELMKRASSGGD
jgi:uncharacterized protein with HEPN domain